MVAALCTWHEHHERAATEINRRLDAKEVMILAAPALVETYSVLTRLPPPNRLGARDALALLDASFMRIGRTVALDSASYRSLLRQAATDGVAGGRTYDVVITRCALQAKAAALLTFNTRHFSALAPPELAIVAPAVG